MLLYTMIISKGILKQMYIKQSILELHFENIFLWCLVFFPLLKIEHDAFLLCRIKTKKRIELIRVDFLCLG